VNDAIINMMSDPAGQWIVSIVLSILLVSVSLLIFKILWALPPAVRRTLLLLVLVVLFFPLIFLLLACTPDPDD
jgi:phosphoglycerol transferase MdoB-like AlkP superfamily enzyme